MPRGWLPAPRGIFAGFCFAVPPGLHSGICVLRGKALQIKPRSLLRKTENKEQSIATPVTKTKRDRALLQLVQGNHGEAEPRRGWVLARLGPSFCGATWLWGKGTQFQQGASQSLLRAWWPLRSVGAYEVYPCPPRTCCSGRLLRSSQKRGLGTL